MLETPIPVQLELDPDLVRQASALGPLDSVVAGALREALSPQTRERRRRWAEENALLVEALAGGVEELQIR